MLNLSNASICPQPDFFGDPLTRLTNPELAQLSGHTHHALTVDVAKTPEICSISPGDHPLCQSSLSKSCKSCNHLFRMDMWKNVENIPSFWSHRIKPIKRLLQDDPGIQSSRIANDQQSHETNDAKKQISEKLCNSPGG